MMTLLPYALLRTEIRSGDLLLCQGTSPMSRMIQYATGSPYSHVAFILRLDTLDRIAILESVESIGIRVCMLSSYVQDYNGSGLPYPGRLHVARHRQMNLQDDVHLLTFSRAAVDLLGYPYGTQDILNITTRIVAAKLGMPTRPIRTDRTFICSEFVQTVYQSIGIDVPYNTTNFISPGDFAACPDVSVLWEIEAGAAGPQSPGRHNDAL